MTYFLILNQRKLHMLVFTSKYFYLFMVFYLFKIKGEIDEMHECNNKQKYALSHQIKERVLEIKKDIEVT